MSALLEPEVFRTLMEELPVGIYFTDLQRRIVFWNSGAERITGFLSQEVVGRCCRDEILVHCDHKEMVVCATGCPLAEALADGKPREASLFLRHKTGHRIPIRIYAMPIRDAAGAIVGTAECFQRQRYIPQPDRREVAGFYNATRLPDFASMVSEIGTRLAHVAAGAPAFGLLCLKVDRWDEVRTSRGLEACETILHVIANTFKNTVRPGDCLGLWSEDRLLLVVHSALVESVQRAGERFRGLTACSSVVWWGDPVPVTISCGGTVARSEDTLESLTRRAERALQNSVAQGGNRVTVVTE